MDHVNILAANILLHLHKRLAVGKGCNRALAQFHANGFADGPRQGFVCRSGKYFHKIKTKWLLRLKWKTRRTWRMNRYAIVTTNPPAASRNCSIKYFPSFHNKTPTAFCFETRHLLPSRGSGTILKFYGKICKKCKLCKSPIFAPVFPVS